ncbi:tyrosine-type recombinase/integrase [Saliphagus infecundisoli]|uniref:Tyrosine-type recombinase/integrase n=1 Tax=Saliphagus infecundisoli TaxID=1849069 RepID=A0ABD5QBU3_9EURY|nr:tyrosine-type recombinase/integrase [Saliphagus infecundisoli]
MTDNETLAEIRDEVKAIREDNRELRKENSELRKELRAIRKGGDKPDPPSNDDIVSGFFTTRNYAKSTERPYRLSIKYFRDYLGDEPLCHVSEQDALDFAANWSGREGNDVATSTMEAYLRRVKKLYDWMCDREWGPETNTVATALDRYKSQNSAELRRSGQHNGTALQPHEYTALLKWNRSPRIYALLMLAAKTGLRRKELALLKVEDVDLDSKKLYNRSPKGVGDTRLAENDADQKLLDDETVDAVRDWLETHGGDMDWMFANEEGNHVSTMTISRWVEKATDRVVQATDDDELAEVIDEFTPHDARRCFTTWLNRGGCSRDVIKGLRGDAAGDMVTLYTQYNEDEIREEYESAMPSIGV